MKRICPFFQFLLLFFLPDLRKLRNPRSPLARAARHGYHRIADDLPDVPNPRGIMLQILSLVIGVVALACYIMVVVQMFKHGKTGPGLFSTLGLLLCGLGYLFAFVYGWMKAGEWRIQNVMYAWTVCLIANIALGLMLPNPMAQFNQGGVAPAPAGRVVVPGAP